MSDLRRSLRIRDFAWLTLAALLGLLFVLDIAEVFVAIARHHWAELLGAPVALLFFYWTTAGAWRRTLWGARRRARRADSTAAGSAPLLDPRAFAIFVPGGMAWYLRRTGADGVVALRSVVIMMAIALLALTTTLTTTKGLPNGPVTPWLPVLLASAASSALLVHLTGRRPLDCSSDESLANSYISLGCLRVALASSVALTAFAFTVIGGPVWIYFVGLGYTLARYAYDVAPTGRVLARDQHRLHARGCERSLTVALGRTSDGL